jgi:hypothetical protein
VLQTVIQLGTAIYGKSLSGGATNRFQKLMHVVNLSTVQCSRGGVFRTNFSKLGGAYWCGSGHTIGKWLQPWAMREMQSWSGLPLLIRAIKGTCAGEVRDGHAGQG